MEKKLKCVELFLDETTFDNVTLISIVEEPAIETDFMLFSKDKQTQYIFAKGDKLKMEVVGPAMIPNKNIFRINETTGEEFNVFFSEETVIKASQIFMRNNNNKSTSIDHTFPVEDVYLYESWIVAGEKDKAYELGFDVPIGTWMVTMKVNNPNVWDAIVNQSVRGFSIEGFFSEKFAKLNVVINEDDEKVKEIMKYMKAYNYFTAIDIDADTKFGGFRITDLDRYYTWQLSEEDESCPACVAWSEMPPTKLINWIDMAIPGKPNGTTIADFETNYATAPFGTFCEHNCQCKLVLLPKNVKIDRTKK